VRLSIGIEIAISIFSSQNKNNEISFDELLHLPIPVVDFFVAEISF